MYYVFLMFLFVLKTVGLTRVQNKIMICGFVRQVFLLSTIPRRTTMRTNLYTGWLFKNFYCWDLVNNAFEKKIVKEGIYIVFTFDYKILIQMYEKRLPFSKMTANLKTYY